MLWVSAWCLVVHLQKHVKMSPSWQKHPLPKMLADMDIKMDDRGENAAGIFDNQFHKRKVRPLAERLACMASKVACGTSSAVPKKW